MTDELIILKELFYDKLSDYLKADKKLKDNSVLLSLKKISSNSVLDYLSNSSVPSQEIDPLVLKSLLMKKYVRCGAKFSHYVITAKAIYDIENNIGYLDLDKLIDDIDKEYFNIENIGGQLKDPDKVVILSIISLRAFYEKAPINRNNGEDTLNKVGEILIKSRDFLVKMKRIEYFDFTNPSQEHIVEAIFRRSNDLKKRTRNIYCFTRNKTCWLDVYDELKEYIYTDRLGYLFWKIFGNDITANERREIIKFCNDLLIYYKNYIYNNEELKYFVFSKIKYQNIIEDSLLTIIDNKAKWKEIDK